MGIENMNELFEHFLKDIYYAEKKIDKSLPAMIEKASDSKLQTLLKEHHEETKGQIKRLEEVFSKCGMKAEAVKCEAIDGIIEEAEELMKETRDAETRDAAITAAAQAVEHYEITRYGTLASWANLLDKSDCAALLAETLEEERGADEKLNKVAEERLNRKAA